MRILSRILETGPIARSRNLMIPLFNIPLICKFDPHPVQSYRLKKKEIQREQQQEFFECAINRELRGLKE
jgi:hypothetical protein